MSQLTDFIILINFSLVGEGQPYLIGYLAVVNLVQSRLCGFGGLVIDTAGGFVDKNNIEQIAPLAEKGVR